MEKQPPSPVGPLETFKTLEAQLFSGKITPKVFLKKIEDLDQDDRSRESSLRATEVLSHPAVEELLKDSPDRVMFYNLRSLSYFHKAQIRLRQGDMHVEDDLTKALNDSEEIAQQNVDWSNYIRATIAYLKNDMEEVQRYAVLLTENKSLVENFVLGLEERGREMTRMK